MGYHRDEIVSQLTARDSVGNHIGYIGSKEGERKDDRNLKRDYRVETNQYLVVDLEPDFRSRKALGIAQRSRQGSSSQASTRLTYPHRGRSNDVGGHLGEYATARLCPVEGITHTKGR